jgi:hypothetical protein
MKLKSNKNNNQSSLIDNQLEMPSTLVERALQINPFIPNKANVKTDKMNLSLIILKGYEALWLTFGSIRAKNKANSNPIKPNQSQFWPNFKGEQSQTNPIQTHFYSNVIINISSFVTSKYGKITRWRAKEPNLP